MWLRIFLLLMSLLAGFAHADEAASRQLMAELLALTGTAAVFDSPRVQAAVADPMPFLGDAVAARRDRLLAEAGFRRWQPPRVWLLQARTDAGVEHWDSLAPVLGKAVQGRGYSLVDAAPLLNAEEAIAFLAPVPGNLPASSLAPGKEHPGLAGLLAAYGADVLVVLRGKQWVLWHPDYRRQGLLPGAGLDLLPDVLAEAVAAEQQWPEARGRAVVQVNGAGRLADFAGVQAALQALPGGQQVQLIRVGPGQLWFALSAPQGQALAVALDGELRLPAARQKPVALPSLVREAYRLACPLFLRLWRPDAAVTKLPGAPVSSVQLPDAPSHPVRPPAAPLAPSLP